MKCPWRHYDVTDVLLAYIVTCTVWMLSPAADMTSAHDYTSDMSTSDPTTDSMSQLLSPTGQEICCSGVLGYASDHLPLNFPCQNRPCCNGSETVAVVAIDFSLGFRFQCMSRNTIETLCYENGAEVRTSNQDPDFIPRACCQGLKFKVVLNQWYAAMVVKCVEEEEEVEKNTS